MLVGLGTVTGKSSNRQSRWKIKTLRNVRASVRENDLAGYGSRSYVAANKSHDVVHGGAGLEHSGDTDFLQGIDILIGNDSADQYQNVVHLVLLEQVHHPGHDSIVRARKNRQTDDLHIFLQGGAHNHFGGLPQSGVNHFHARIAQGASNYFGPAVMSVKSGLGHQHADFKISHHSSFNHIGWDRAQRPGADAKAIRAFWYRCFATDTSRP